MTLNHLWHLIRRRIGAFFPVLQRPPMSDTKACAFADGHFYSPIVNVPDILAHESQIWPQQPTVVGIDFNDASHEHILREIFPRYYADFDYPETAVDENTGDKFFKQNSQFGWLDAPVLFALLRHWQPAKIIEVGSGFSSLLIADVNQRFLAGKTHITCIEPYPRPFLKAGIAGISTLIENRVEDIDLAVFASLGAGDILFIDSSHVSKTGSDVNYLYFEIVPRLAKGVIIHIHDIFLPHDYPREWVIDENRCWNEQYLVRAMLMLNLSFKVEFGCAYAFHRFPALVKTALAHPDGRNYGGGSLWIRKTV